MSPPKRPPSRLPTTYIGGTQRTATTGGVRTVTSVTVDSDGDPRPTISATVATTWSKMVPNCPTWVPVSKPVQASYGMLNG